MSTEDLYERFAERFFENGSADIPDEWPDEVKEMCRFLVRMNSERESTVVEAIDASVISLLADDGIEADISLGDGAPTSVGQGPSDAEVQKRYAIEGEIGRGGMGRVLLAYDRDFRRRVAMKVLRSSSHRTQASRFLEEAQATAQLEHPNIGPIYDLGVNADRSPYFTMKWIRGRDLSEVLHGPGGELSLIRLLQMLQQASMGVRFANSRGVIHRDLKPQNIMVGDFGEILVVDWGLAKILDREEISTGDAEGPEDDVSTARRRRQCLARTRLPA